MGNAPMNRLNVYGKDIFAEFLYSQTLDYPVVVRSNKKSAESGVAPAGIKSHKFLLVLKRNFAVLKKLMG